MSAAAAAAGDPRGASADGGRAAATPRGDGGGGRGATARRGRGAAVLRGVAPPAGGDVRAAGGAHPAQRPPRLLAAPAGDAEPPQLPEPSAVRLPRSRRVRPGAGRVLTACVRRCVQCASQRVLDDPQALRRNA